MVGENIRRARHARGLSLEGVAGPAGISAATLSRIETGKQALHVSMLMSLAQILTVSPHELIPEDGEGMAEPISDKVSGLDPKVRAALWRDLAETTRQRRPVRWPAGQLEAAVDELLAHLDYLRAEIESVRKRVR